MTIPALAQRVLDHIDADGLVKVALAGLGLDGEVELFVYRPAYEADPVKVRPLAAAITRAHEAPALTFGPGVSVGGGNFRMPIATLVTGARLYALTALELGNQDRSA